MRPSLIEDYLVVNKNNLEEISHRLNQTGGNILIAETETFMEATGRKKLNGIFDLNLFHRPEIMIKHHWLKARRQQLDAGGIISQIGWEHDRHYQLRDKHLFGTRESEVEIFSKLTVGDCQLQINFQSCVGRSVFGHSAMVATTYYVPETNSLENCLSRIFNDLVKLGKKYFSIGLPVPFDLKPDQLKTVVNYLLTDLATREILDHNILVGQRLDYCQF